MKNSSYQSFEEKENNSDVNPVDSLADVDVAASELDLFVSGNRLEALEYLKMLRDEITKSDQSRSRYTLLTWLLGAIFMLMDFNAISLKIDLFEKFDQVLIYKMLPAATICCYYIMMSRIFVQRERLVIYFEISRRLFPCKNFPLNYYIKPTHFMLAERLLNISRPRHEVLGNVFVLGLIVTVTTYGPIAIAVYGYYSLLTKFGITDPYIVISFAVGCAALIQALVSLRGTSVMNKQDLDGKVSARARKGN
jgi:hypothetical protein